jgi:hypothetical protein
VAAVNPWVVCTLEGLLDGHLGLEAVVFCVETGTVVVRRTPYVLDVGRSKMVAERVVFQKGLWLEKKG